MERRLPPTSSCEIQGGWILFTIRDLVTQDVGQWVLDFKSTFRVNLFLRGVRRLRNLTLLTNWLFKVNHLIIFQCQINYLYTHFNVFLNTYWIYNCLCIKYIQTNTPKRGIAASAEQTREAEPRFSLCALAHLLYFLKHNVHVPPIKMNKEHISVECEDNVY